MASVFSDCGFDVVSLASNHAMDWGEDALLDTIDLFRERGMQVVGAGRNLREARRPAFVERNGVRVAVLAYCSILQTGYAAGHDKAGIAPLRAHTYYEPFDYQAGVPPRVVTVPYEEDLAGMVEDIAAAKKAADVVVLSLHWGIHFIPRMIADYQPCGRQRRVRSGRRPDPRPPRAHAEGDRRARRKGLLLQPEQLHHVLDREDARARPRSSRSSTAS